jgi:hypothetical protein
MFCDLFSQNLMDNDSVVRGLSLLSFIIKPVQRLCKYPLLIRVRNQKNSFFSQKKNKNYRGGFALKWELIFFPTLNFFALGIDE